VLGIRVLLIDLTLIGIVVFCGWRGYKNGLIRGAFGVVALIVSLLIANITASAYSGEVTGMLQPFVGGVVDSAIHELVEDGHDFSVQALIDELELDDIDISEYAEYIDNLDFGTAYAALRHIGLPDAAAAKVAEMAVELEIKEPGVMISDLIAEKLSGIFAFVAVFGVAFALLAITFAVIGNLVGLVFSLPGLRLVDIITGAALGLVKGIIIVFAIGVVVRYFGLLAINTLEETSILSFIVNNNPVANMLGV